MTGKSSMPVRPSCTASQSLNPVALRSTSRWRPVASSAIPMRWSCIADGRGGLGLSRAWWPLMQLRQTKARAPIFPLRDPERSERNPGGRSHRTAWADSRGPQLEVRGHEYHRSDRPLSSRWESRCPIETDCCADQDHSFWACRSRQPGTRRVLVRVSAKNPPRTKMRGRPTRSNASKL
jgi:hypothetical protein